MLSHKLQQRPTIESPTRQYTTGTKPMTSQPYFQEYYTDASNHVCERYLSTPDAVARVTLKELREDLLELKTDSNGKLLQPKWKEQLPDMPRNFKANFLIDKFNDLRPKHFIPLIYASQILQLDGGGKVDGKRGGKDSKHGFLVVLYVKCMAYTDGCENSAFVGLYESDIRKLVRGEVADIPFVMKFYGNCAGHRKNKNYTKFRGSARNKYIDTKRKGEVILKPSQIVKNDLGGELFNAFFYIFIAQSF